MLRPFSLLLFLAFVKICSRQENTENDVGNWMVFSMENQLSEKWSVPLIGTPSYENWAEQTEFGFARTGLTYKTSPN